MGLPHNLGRLSPAITSDASLNIGIGVTPSGTYKLQVNGTVGLSGALTGTSATFSGLITSTIGVNNYLRASNTSTDGLFIENSNNGNTSYYGINNSTGSLFFTGSTAYSTNIGNASARDFHIGTNGIVRLTIASTGAATFSSSVTAASGLYNGYTSGLPPTSGSATRGGLRLNNASNIALDFGTVAAGQAWIQVSDAGNYASNFPLLLNPNGGNVLIGTTTDAGYKLDVNGIGRFSGQVTIKSGNGNQLVLDNAGERFTQMYFYNNNTLKSAIWWDNNTSKFEFYTGVTALSIASTGAATFSGNVQTTAGNIISQLSSANDISLLINPTATAVRISASYNVTGSYQPLTFSTSDTERMRITSGGNVLIGTTTDNGAKLQVSGNTFISGFTSNQLGNHGEKFISLSGPNSAHSFDVATQFPSLAISGNVLGVTMFITIFGSGGSVQTCIATIARNSAGTWASYGLTASSSTVSLLQSVTGSGTTITINTNAGSYVGVKVTAATQ